MSNIFRTRRHAIAAAVTAFLAPVAPAMAQSQAQTQSLPQIEVVDRIAAPNGRLDLDTPSTTGSRLGLTSRETPASVTVVSFYPDASTDPDRSSKGSLRLFNALPPGRDGFHGASSTW